MGGFRSSRNSLPVERISNDAGEIFHATADVVSGRCTVVFGRLRNGFGVSEVRDAHIDVKLIGADRRLLGAWTTDYFPRPIPPEAHGHPERAFFVFQLPLVPAAGSTIQVAFHSSRLGECAFTNSTLSYEP